MASPKRGPVSVRVQVMITPAEKAALRDHCADELRSFGSWFRYQIRRAWRTRKAPRRLPELQRFQGDGVRRKSHVMARVTEEERDQLEVLAADEGVSLSGWFRKRLDAELGPVVDGTRRRKAG